MERNNKQAFTKINKWLILVVATIVTMVDFALLFSLGAIYIDVMETYKADRATAAVVQSLMTGVTLGFGVFSGALITTFGLPIVTMIASVLVPFGFMTSFFITNIHVLYITIGIISAIGTSMAHMSSVTVAGRVFKGRHQLMSITILNTAVGFASLGYPYLLSCLTRKFGLSGTFLILGGITSNTFLLFIVCFIYRKALADDESSEQSQMPNEDEDLKTIPSTKTFKIKPYLDISNDGKTVTNRGRRSNTEFISNNEDTEIVDDISDREEENNLQTNFCEHEILMEIYSKHGNETKPSDMKEIKENYSNAKNNDFAMTSHDDSEYMIIENKKDEEIANRSLLETSARCNDNISKLKIHYRKIQFLFKELMTGPYVCLVLAFAFGNISLNGYLGVKIDIAFWKGLNASEGLTSFLVFNCSNIVSRFVPGLLKERKGINSIFYPVFSAVSGFCGQLLIYFSGHISVYMVGVCFCGIAFGGIVSSSINATVRIVRLELVPIAVGFLISVNGVLIVGIGPLFGAIRDMSGSYGSVIITICTAQAIAAMFYLAAMVLRKRNKSVIELDVTESAINT